VIWHLLPLERWRAAGHSGYVPGTEDAEPFVHASPDLQTALAVANLLFRDGDAPLVGLCLDTEKLAAPVRYEPADPAPPPGVPARTLFPHVYGPVETAAVTQVRYARRDPSGAYTGFEVRPVTAEALDLLPHPEGGWYAQTWASDVTFAPPGYGGQRAAATAIYFLLAPGDESRWHTVRSDEIWLWHAGGPLHLLLGDAGAAPSAQPRVVTLGQDLGAGHRPQHVVPGGCWQSARPATTAEVLVSCIVAPGFDFADFAVHQGALRSMWHCADPFPYVVTSRASAGTQARLG
jgi:uncharacterized protein